MAISMALLSFCDTREICHIVNLDEFQWAMPKNEMRYIHSFLKNIFTGVPVVALW